MKEKVLRVVLPGGSIKNLIASEYPENPAGYRVLTDRGKTGIVVGITDEPPEGSIIAFPDKGRLILEEHIKVLKEIAEDYAYIWGIILFELLPSAFIWEKEEVVRLRKRDIYGLDRISQELINYLKKRREVKYENLKKRFNFRLIKTLEEKGFIEIKEEWRFPEVEEKFYRLKVSPEEALRKVRSEEKKRIIEFLAERLYVSEEEIKEKGFKRRALRELVKKGIVEEFSEYIGSIKYVPLKAGKVVYRPLKENALIWDSFKGSFEKLTDICERNMNLSSSTLIIFPDTEDLFSVREKLINIFGDRVKEIHSGIKPKKLIENWFSSSEHPCIILSTYKGILVPAYRLRTVIVFNESSAGVKLKIRNIDLRRVAVRLSKKLAAETVFFTPSPTLSSYYWIKKTEGSFIKKDFENVKIEIIKREPKEVITESLFKELSDRKEKSVIILVPKEGYSYVFCPKCETVVLCPNCGSYLTLSKERNVIYCSSCRKKLEENVCPECGSEIKETGFGIEKAKEILERFFEGFEYSVSPLWHKEHDISVILNADIFLSLPTFRAKEKLFLYIFKALVSTREKLIIQTMFPEEEIFKLIKEKRFEEIYERELEERRINNLPPFSRTVLIKVSDFSAGKKVYEMFYPNSRMTYSYREENFHILITFKRKEDLKKIEKFIREYRKYVVDFSIDSF